jgi:hypothetical protein
MTTEGVKTKAVSGESGKVVEEKIVGRSESV